MCIKKVQELSVQVILYIAIVLLAWQGRALAQFTSSVRLYGDEAQVNVRGTVLGKAYRDISSNAYVYYQSSFISFEPILAPLGYLRSTGSALGPNGDMVLVATNQVRSDVYFLSPAQGHIVMKINPLNMGYNMVPRSTAGGFVVGDETFSTTSTSDSRAFLWGYGVGLDLTNELVQRGLTSGKIESARSIDLSANYITGIVADRAPGFPYLGRYPYRITLNNSGQIRYEMRALPLGIFSSSSATGSDVNSSGTVVGASTLDEAFVWELNGTLARLSGVDLRNVPGASGNAAYPKSRALTITEDDIVAGYVTDSADKEHAVVWFSSNLGLPLAQLLSPGIVPAGCIARRVQDLVEVPQAAGASKYLAIVNFECPNQEFELRLLST